MLWIFEGCMADSWFRKLMHCEHLTEPEFSVPDTLARDFRVLIG